MTDVGTRIRSARILAQLSQQELGEKVGRTSKTIRRYEQGKTEPDTGVLRRIARSTEQPIEFFVRPLLPALVQAEARRPDGRPGHTPSPPEAAGRRRPDRTAHNAGVRMKRLPPRTGIRTAEVHMLPRVGIKDAEIVRTDDDVAVPGSLLTRIGIPADRAHVLEMPAGHYDARLHFSQSDLLILDLYETPAALDVLTVQNRFVDGLYIVQIGSSALQIKDLSARPDGAIVVASPDQVRCYRCSPDDLPGITLYAKIATTY